jgi:AcrR family transcriptional regulator
VDHYGLLSPLYGTVEDMSEATVRPRRLTPKGEAVRQKIIEAAAVLIYERGVAGTSNELVRSVTGISGSQLSHYFPDKESLVRAVIAWRADTMIGLQRDPPLGELDKHRRPSRLGPLPHRAAGCVRGRVQLRVSRRGDQQGRPGRPRRDRRRIGPVA